VRLFDTLHFSAKMTVIYENLIKRIAKMAKTSMNSEEDLAKLRYYVLGWIAGIIFLALDKVDL